MRKTNLSLLLITAAALLTTISGFVVLHRLQSARVAEAFLIQARKASAEGQHQNAVLYWTKYLELRPRDSAARAELGHALAVESLNATYRKGLESAYFHLERVLNEDASRDDVRRLLVKVAIGLERFDKAREQVDILLQNQPNISANAILDGELLEAQGQLARAAAAYRRCMDAFPADIDTYLHLAHMLRRHPDSRHSAEHKADADLCIDTMAASNPNSVRAQLARYHYFMDYDGADDPSRLQKAEDSLKRAAELAPEDADVLLGQGRMAQRYGDWGKAKGIFERGVAVHPKDGRFYQARAALSAERGLDTLAIQELNAAVEHVPPRDQIPLFFDLTELLIDSGNLTDARVALERLRGAQPPAILLDFLHGRLAVSESKWNEAAQLLERVAAGATRVPELRNRTDRLLAMCYEQLGEPAGLLAAWLRIVIRKPNSIPARLRLAHADLESGRSDAAIDQYRQIVALPGAPTQAWSELLRLLIARESSRVLPDWHELEALLKRADDAKVPIADRLVLRGDWCIAQGEWAQAEDALSKARQTDPSSIHAWIASARLAQLNGSADEARKFLEEGQHHAGDSLDLRLAWIHYWEKRGGDDAVKALGQLLEGVNSYPKEERARLLSDAAAAFITLGSLSSAEAALEELAKQPGYEQRLPVRRRLFELALARGDESAIDGRLRDIERIEGTHGPTWQLCEAESLVRAARSGAADALPRAREIIEGLRAERPNWTPVVAAQGNIADLEGNFAQAIVYLRQAVTLGERRDPIVNRLLELLRTQQRFREADEVMRILGKRD